MTINIRRILVAVLLVMLVSSCAVDAKHWWEQVYTRPTTPWIPNATFVGNASYDNYNGTYLGYWLFNASQGEFNLYGLAFSLVAPFTVLFNYWFFLIIWMTFLGIVWIRSGDVTIPLVIGLITASGFALLIPEEAILYIIVMFAICAAVILLKVYRD